MLTVYQTAISERRERHLKSKLLLSVRSGGFFHLQITWIPSKTSCFMLLRKQLLWALRSPLHASCESILELLHFYVLNLVCLLLFCFYIILLAVHRRLTHNIFVGGFEWGIGGAESCFTVFCGFGCSDSCLGNCWLRYFSFQMKIRHFKDQLSLNQPVISHFVKFNMPPVTLVHTSCLKTLNFKSTKKAQV